LRYTPSISRYIFNLLTPVAEVFTASFHSLFLLLAVVAVLGLGHRKHTTLLTFFLYFPCITPDWLRRTLPFFAFFFLFKKIDRLGVVPTNFAQAVVVSFPFFL
jgi:hypothetical protein